jgi:uncharacterized membrane protein
MSSTARPPAVRRRVSCWKTFIAVAIVRESLPDAAVESQQPQWILQDTAFPTIVPMATLRLIAALAAASALSVAALLVEIHETGSSFYRFLVWNLFLAWVPLGAALACHALARRRAYAVAVGAGVIWLLFFPNAPYMLTDYIHIGEAPSPLWWDALMLSSFVWTSLMLGFFSLYLMQDVWRAHFGRFVSWLLAALALALGSFGVYLGRFVRLNSWDALLHPRSVAHIIATQLENPFHEPRLIGVLGLLTAFMLISYAVVRSFASFQDPIGGGGLRAGGE